MGGLRGEVGSADGFCWRIYKRTLIEEKHNLDFQINDETYFASLGDGEWQVFVSTPTGAREIPVYDDEADVEDSLTLVEDKRRRKIVN
jgi:hypothetical protein